MVSPYICTMFQSPDILTLAYQQPVMQGELELIWEKEQQIPGSVQYLIRRYERKPQWAADDTGMMVYHYTQSGSADNYLELKFCVTGNTYCDKKSVTCLACRENSADGCVNKVSTVDLLSFRFSAIHLARFARANTTGGALTEKILNFRHASSFTKTISICGRSAMVLEALLNHSYSDSLENIYINAQTQMLLLFCLDCMVGEKDVESFQCRFLANESDREKIIQAREVLLQHIGEPITIKELSRKVAINECYLKKGFKELFGITVFDFYQSQRMEHARYLLYEKGLSVTEVSMLLGYSSISHFSTAFKKHTGLKPCELLFRG